MKTAAAIIIALALVVGYNVWLNQGCQLAGVMTWHGKVCTN